jgi:hypothetical protein
MTRPIAQVVDRSANTWQRGREFGFGTPGTRRTRFHPAGQHSTRRLWAMRREVQSSSVRPDTINRVVYRSRFRPAVCVLVALAFLVPVLAEGTAWGTNLDGSYPSLTLLRNNGARVISAAVDSGRASSRVKVTPRWLGASESCTGGVSLCCDLLRMSHSCAQRASSSLRLHSGRSPPPPAVAAP